MITSETAFGQRIIREFGVIGHDFIEFINKEGIVPDLTKDITADRKAAADFLATVQGKRIRFKKRLYCKCSGNYPGRCTSFAIQAVLCVFNANISDLC